MPSDAEFATLGAMSTVLKLLLFLLHKGHIEAEPQTTNLFNHRIIYKA